MRGGEVVGVAGLVGAGRTELAKALFGIRHVLSGEVLLDGQPMKVRHPEQAIGAGLLLVPEDRRLHGLLLEASIPQGPKVSWFPRGRARSRGTPVRSRRGLETPRRTRAPREKEFRIPLRKSGLAGALNGGETKSSPDRPGGRPPRNERESINRRNDNGDQQPDERPEKGEGR